MVAINSQLKDLLLKDIKQHLDFSKFTGASVCCTNYMNTGMVLDLDYSDKLVILTSLLKSFTFIRNVTFSIEQIKTARLTDFPT